MIRIDMEVGHPPDYITASHHTRRDLYHGRKGSTGEREKREQGRKGEHGGDECGIFHCHDIKTHEDLVTSRPGSHRQSSFGRRSSLGSHSSPISSSGWTFYCPSYPFSSWVSPGSRYFLTRFSQHFGSWMQNSKKPICPVAHVDLLHR